MSVQDWIAGYGRAWEERDPDAAAALFSENAIYRDHPLGEPHAGREGVHAYWTGVTATQEDVRVRFGTPVVSADASRAAVEFWVTMLGGGTEVTLAGILFLRFGADGLCEELREAWHFAEGRSEPPAGWGT
jgi:hypothetical protein